MSHAGTALGGQLVFRPGRDLPTITSNRTALAQRLLRGRPAADAPQQLSRLYALCGRAHGLTARLAIDAANDLRTAPTAHELSGFIVETAREHVRRIWMDWPRLISGQVPDNLAAVLGECPLFRYGVGADKIPPVLQGWLETHLLGEAAAPWLAQWDADPEHCMQQWTARADTMPARLLAAVNTDACALQAAGPTLLPHRQPAYLRALAAAMADDEEFGSLPSQAGMMCETGVWTRLAAQREEASPVANAWLRLGARIAELVRLSVPAATQTDTPPLAIGAMALGPGQALAWSEMARGLLIHLVRLAPAVDSDVAQVADYRIVAPTEWNFHPRGIVARALADMPAPRSTASRQHIGRQVAILAAAFDPCVDYRIEFEHA